jgi:hypothetical protein
VQCFVANAVTTGLTQPRYGTTLAQFHDRGVSVTKILQSDQTYLVLVGLSSAIVNALRKKMRTALSTPQHGMQPLFKSGVHPVQVAQQNSRSLRFFRCRKGLAILAGISPSSSSGASCPRTARFPLWESERPKLRSRCSFVPDSRALLFD